MHTTRTEAIRADFVAGKISGDNLLLHLEPVLSQAANDPGTQHEARTLVNRIERALFTEAEQRKSSAVVHLLDACVAFVRSIELKT